MSLIKRTWFLILISLFGGGFVTEVIHLSTGDPNRPRTTNLTLLYALIIYGLFLLVIKNSDKKTP
jgi:hypothetical protein